MDPLRCRLCDELLPAPGATRCPACGSAQADAPLRPVSIWPTPRLCAGLYMGTCGVVAALVLLGLVVGTVLRARRQQRGEQLLSALHEGAPAPPHAHVGGRWTFALRCMAGGLGGTEAWDVVAAGPEGASFRRTPIAS